MRRQLIATTALIALAAVLVLGIPLGFVESARARADALGRLEREADGIAAAAGAPQRVNARALSPWLRPGHAADIRTGATTIRIGRMPNGSVLSTRSGATQGVRVIVYASADEVTRRRRQVWLLVARPRRRRHRRRSRARRAPGPPLRTPSATTRGHLSAARLR